MKAKLLIATVFTALTLEASAQATGLVPDASAYRACKQRFYTTIRDENLNIRPEAFYKLPTDDPREYHFVFNASGPGVESGRTNYKIECEARKIGRVTSFEIEEGRWVFTRPPREGLARK